MAIIDRYHDDYTILFGLDVLPSRSGTQQVVDGKVSGSDDDPNFDPLDNPVILVRDDGTIAFPPVPLQHASGDDASDAGGSQDEQDEQEDGDDDKEAEEEFDE